MRNPWRMQDGPNNQINRNNFPMSFQYNGTFRYGKIYPVGLWRTIPGATYQIDPTLALNFMPTTFPIQTRQRAYVHFFYGRDRNFWSDYKDFVNGMKPDLVKPYLDTAITKPRTGSLLDYLGVPTTIVGSYANFEELELITDFTNEGGFPIPFGVSDSFPTKYNFSFNSVTSSSPDFIPPIAKFFDFNSTFPSGSIESFYSKLKPSGLIPNYSSQSLCYYKIYLNDKMPKRIRLQLSNNYSFVTGSFNDWLNSNFPISANSFGDALQVNSNPTTFVADSNKGNVDVNTTTYKPLDSFALLLEESGQYRAFVSPTLLDNGMIEFDLSGIASADSAYILMNAKLQLPYGGSASTEIKPFIGFTSGNPYMNLFVSSVSAEYGTDTGLGEVHDIDDSNSPYWRSGASTDLRSRIKLNAIPCRMYETIYNLYYRNPQNNPYILDGKPEYNKFIPSKDGGVDSNLYELRYRNWEDDFLTTAVQSPQQGIAPLVGLTDRGATVTLTNDDGSVTRYVTNLDENGNVTGIETTDSSEPMLTQALIDAVSYGISIEDLRNVNAMQKWLELNLRKGYQYKDIIEARWGISISYNELDLPEFIGGFTQEVGMQAVTQTANIDDSITGQLGWQAGRMYCAGEGRQITHYCEEEGYIMALLCVVPVPNYSQLLPKHWFTRDLLDSYQPEFNHIGFQPITYKEVCPIQAYQESSENVDVLEQTFGYQRPWYEYFNQVDEVHGQFRTTLKDYLINRVFNVKPELSESFLLVDPDQINDVFNVTEDDDKILGAINYRITAKLPISLYAQARLE